MIAYCYFISKIYPHRYISVHTFFTTIFLKLLYHSQPFEVYPPSQSFVARKGEVLAAFKLVLDKSLINSKAAERAVPKDFRILGEHHLWHKSAVYRRSFCFAFARPALHPVNTGDDVAFFDFRIV